MTKLTHFFSKKSNIVLLFILLLAGFMRLYRIGDYMTFLGDEGRDLLAVLRILQGDFVFLGPRSSAADFYYGPIYFYMITPFLWLFNYDPVGPAIFIALVGVATVYLVYRIGKEFFGEAAGLFAAGLYTVAPVIIAYSRSSWNPNPLPFVSLLTLYLAYKAILKKSWKYFLSVGVLMGIAIQLQYLALFLGIVLFVFILIGSIITFRSKDSISTILSLKFISDFGIRVSNLFIGFVIGWSPFIAFEIKNNFPNVRTIVNYVVNGNSDRVYPTGMGFVENIEFVFLRLFNRLMLRYPPPDQLQNYQSGVLDLWASVGVLLGLAAIAGLVWYYAVKIPAISSQKKQLVLMLFVLWLGVGSFLFGFYKREIYDYYLGYMFPLPFLLVGNFLGRVWEKKHKVYIFKALAFGIFAGLFFFNVYANPFKYEPNRQKNQAKTIAEFVLSKTNGKPYNFAFITKGNSDHMFRYFFEINKRPPVELLNTAIDPQRNSVTDQLLVVCDYTDCEPLGNSLWEVAGFGRAEIVGEWDVSVVKVFKLVKYKE